MRLALAILLVLGAAVPARAQEKEDDPAKIEQKREENRLLKKARRSGEEGTKEETYALYLQLYSLAQQHEDEEMEIHALDEGRAFAPNETEEARLCGMLGHIHMTRNEHVQSVKAYRRACKLQPENAAHWNSLGYSLHLSGNEEESIGAFEQCLEVDKNNKEARYSIGISYRLAGKPEKALKAHEWLVEHKNELTAGWYFAYESAAQKKHAKGLDMTSLESRKAIVELEVAIDQVFEDDFEPAEKTLARLKEKVPAGDLEAALDVAIDETARALEMRPQHHQLDYLLGLFYEAKGDDEEAKAHFEKFVATDKKVHALARKAKEKLGAADEKKDSK